MMFVLTAVVSVVVLVALCYAGDLLLDWWFDNH